MAIRRAPRASSLRTTRAHDGPLHITKKQFEAIKKANLAERRRGGRVIPPVVPDATRVRRRRARRRGPAAGNGATAAATAAVTFDPRDPATGDRLCTPVRTQPASDPRCIAYAVAAAMETAMCRAQQSTTGATELSVQDVFASAGAQVGAIDTIQTAVIQGVVDATCFPEGATARCASPGPHTWFAKVTAVAGQESKRVQAMRTALETRGPLVSLIQVFSNFGTFTGAGPYVPTGPSANFHAVCIVGYEADAGGKSGRWIAKNSMGSAWGDQGFVRIPWREPRVRAEDVVYVVEGVHQ
jgi:C1A family cysteine protease